MPKSQALLPRFSLRQVLLVTTALGFAFLIASYGVRGSGWAAGIAVGLMSILVALVVYAALFALVWGAAAIGRTVFARRTGHNDKAIG
jgi:hypothetical protein